MKEKYEKVNHEYDNLQSYVNSLELKLHGLEIEEDTLFPKIDDLARVEEDLEQYREEYRGLVSLRNSIEFAKIGLESAYKQMRENISPVFLQTLSKIIEKVTKGAYNNVKINHDSELIIENEDKNYIHMDNLSCGTVYQIYLALRLSFIKEITNENIPIILDEPFAYYDKQRLSAVLRFLREEYCDNQIIIFTCSNREIEALKEENSKYNVINIC